MLRLINIILLFALGVFAYGAPILPSKVTVSCPRALMRRPIKQSQVDALLMSNDWGQSSNSGKFWTVYSDRDNNVTYTASDMSSIVCDTLCFNEKLRIAKIENGFALVYDEKQKGLGYPHISASAISKGWIPMEHLLLWEACPTNEIGIYNKALIVMNIDEMRSGSNKDLRKRYTNPEIRSGEKKLNSSMDSYFIMKKDPRNGLVLLARECEMEGYTNLVLYGWVNVNSYVPWNQRICLEPNWKPQVVESLKGQNIPVYVDTNKTKIRCSVPLGRQNNMTASMATKYRMAPHQMRYLLIENDSKNDELYKVIAFARPDGSASNKDATSANIPSNYLQTIYGTQKEAFNKEDNFMAFQGYVDKKTPAGGDYWQPVLYISSDEFAGLMEKLQPVMTAANAGSTDRRPYIAAMKAIIRSMVPDITEREMDEKDIKEVMALISGLNVKTECLSGRSLLQILDERIVSQSEFDEMIAKFRNKFNKLKRMRELKYAFSIERNNTIWYWIPVEDLP